MRIPRVYLPVPLKAGSSVTLPENAFTHVVRVLRLKPGSPVILFNGQGGEFHGVLETVGRREAIVQIDAFDPREAESPLNILLAQGVAKSESMDYTLQKAVELGAWAIQPVLTERSVSNLPNERLFKRLSHWRGIVAGACEQCGRNRLPAVLEPVQLRDWLACYVGSNVNLVLDPQAERGLGESRPPLDSITVLAGPEGGLSPVEMKQVRAAGFLGVRLGPRVLRTETAGVAALTALQVLWGDLS